MNQVIEQFAAACHDILSKDSGPAGIEQVRKNLEKVLVNKDVTDEYLGPDADSPRNILYEDSSWVSASSPMCSWAPEFAIPTITARPGRSTARSKAPRK